MSAVSSNRISKAPRGGKKSTHQNTHRWESFTSKIAKLHTLDPLKKVRRHDLDAEDLATTTSYFQNGLQRWNELNISRGFVSFKRQALPLSDSLPQILHFEDRIMNLFVEHISLHEKESMEPLFDLLTAFARDLGARFEKHYPRALQLVIEVASKPQDVDVIEWTFTALAFLFKRLYKLLVPDLRPTYDAISPLLGKNRRPPHIARFAAEAMSFLIKKAAAPNHRSTALPLIVERTRQDLYEVHGSRQYELFQDGLMTMYAEAIKGAGDTVHSTGPSIFTTLLQFVPPQDFSLVDPPLWTNLTCGVLTSIIHHTSPTTFAAISEAIYDLAKSAKEDPSSADVTYPAVHLIRAIGVMAGVRKGARVNDWETLVESLSGLLGLAGSWPAATSDDTQEQFWRHVVVNMALVWTYAPVHTLTPTILSFTNTLSRDPFRNWYIPFCAYFSELDPLRFRSLFLSHFQGFVVSNWSDNGNEDLLCIYIDRMTKSYALPTKKDKDVFSVPRQWQDHIVSKFERLEVSPFPERGVYDKDPQTWRDRCLPKYAALLRVLEIAGVHPSTNARIAELLLKKLKLALRPSSTLASDEVHFIVSQGLRAYLRMNLAGGSVDRSLGPLLRAAVPRFCRSVGFLEAYLTYIQQCKESESSPAETGGSESPSRDDDTVIMSLVDNLSCPSHELRLHSLKVLAELDPSGDNPNSAVNAMIEVEQTPLELAQSRSIVMYLRKLGIIYSTLDSTSWTCRAIPTFLFGMLTVKMSPVWDGAIEALQQIAQDKSGEEIVTKLAFDWLNVPSPKWEGSQQLGYSNTRAFKSDFECKNVQRLEALATDFHRVIQNPMETTLKSFDEQQYTVDQHSVNARPRALKVLAALPKLTEKKSRLFVPIFLSWAAAGEDAGEDAGDDSNQKDSEESPAGSSGWSVLDKKGMLGVIGQFVNPGVLYDHAKVYQALLKQLENGDLEFQKLVLKCLLLWKQSGVKPYQENLDRLLEENMFRNELVVLFQGEEQYIQPEHRAELMPILLRLLYGRTISKRGASSRHGLQATRLAVLRNLSAEDMGGFLDIALGGLRDVRVIDSSGNISPKVDQEVVPIRRQVGYLTMMSSFVAEMGVGVLPYMETLLNSILYCLIHACRQLDGSHVDQIESEEGEELPSNTSLLKVARTTAIKCVITLFRNASGFDWTPYADTTVKEVVTPRIAKLPVETAQGISGILQLLSTWSEMPQEALMLSLDARILPQLVECLAVEKGKPEVKVFVLRIIRNLAGLSQAPVEESLNNELIKTELLVPVLDNLLRNLTNLLEIQGFSNELLETCVEAIIELAPIVEGPQSVRGILELSTRFLGQPARRINPRAKGRILLVVERFVALQEPVSNPSSSPELLISIHEAVSALFSYFKDRENRESLCRVYLALATKDPSLQESAELSRELNSYVEGRIDEPHYDRRLAALNSISVPRDQPLSAHQWLPLLHNLIFFARIDEDFSILSSNSADAMRQYIDDAAACTDTEMRAVFESHLKAFLIPALYAGAREESDGVRRQYLRVMGRLVTRMSDWPPVSDMAGLLDGSEEETSEPKFFFNILSPGTSIQLEALQILLQANKKKEIGSMNLANFFIPVLEHFVLGRAEGVDDHGLGAQAILTIAELASSLDWKQYRSTLQRYLGYISSKPERQKVLIRLLGRFVDALADARGPIKEDDGAEEGDDTKEDGVAKEDAMDVDQPQALSEPKGRLSATLPVGEKLTADILNNYLPPLLKHLNEKDESEVSYRVPVGVIVVKLLKLLPSQEMSLRLASVLSDISHILRSKAEESRDMARDTLVKITLILGAEYLGFVLRGLKAALARGYQLHVLSYTMHSILLATIPQFGQGAIDYCLPAIVEVIMDDIFGATGQEKDADGYTTQTKEIKSSKSQDSMELVAKSASITHLADLIRPLQAILLQKVDLKMVRKVDSLLSRITNGLLHNPAADSRDSLIFCYEVIQGVYEARAAVEPPKPSFKIRRYLVQKQAKKGGERGVVNKHTYKLVRFALDIIRTVLKRHDGLRNATNITGLIPIIGDAVTDGEAEVKVAAFKLLNVIVKVPFPEFDITGLYKVALKEATKSIASSSSTTSDLSQAALKFISVVLRDRRDVVVKDAAVDMLVGKLKEDLTDPQYRAVTFNFLRCVLDRKTETAAVYDILDHVGTVMITNHDKDTRDLARGAFFQFLRDYPQKKARWTKQMNFIVANLKYEREGGRLSVMEIIHLLLHKSADDFVQDIAATCFLPLVFVVANDDSEKCRLAAGELLKQIFEKADKEQTQKFLTLLRSWLGNEDNRTVSMLALQVFGFYFEASERALSNEKDLRLVLDHAVGLLRLGTTDESDEETTNAAIDTIRTLSQRFPPVLSSPEHHELWALVRQYMVHSQSSVRLNAVRLTATYLVHFAEGARKTDEGTVLQGRHGAELQSADIEDLVGLLIRILSTPVVSEELATEAGRVLIFLAPHLPTNVKEDSAPGSEEAAAVDEVEDEAAGEDEEEGDEAGEGSAQKKKKDLHFLFWKLSSILRKQRAPKAEAINTKVTAMEVLETVCRRLPVDSFRDSIKTILVPLHHLTDRSIPTPSSYDQLFNTKYEGLKVRAQILMDSLQKVLGTADYSRYLLEIREAVKKRRQERSTKRKIEAVTQPEKFGRDKRKKFEKKKERRKVQGQEHKAARQSFKRW